MQRLFGGKKPGDGNIDGRKTPESMPVTPQISSTSANINGAPSADQRFLSELAVILSEEEEAKKREEAEKRQQEQQAENNNMSNDPSEETTAGSAVASDEIDAAPPAPTTSTDEPQKQEEGSAVFTEKKSGENDGSSSNMDVKQSTNEKPEVVGADSEGNKNDESSAELIEVFDTKVEPSFEAATTDGKDGSQCAIPSVDEDCNTENEVQPEGALLESEGTLRDANSTQDGLENPSSHPLATPAAEEPSVVTSADSVLDNQGNNDIERDTKKESAPKESSGTEDISNDLGECSINDIQDSSPVMTPEVEPSDISRESEQAEGKAKSEEQGNLSGGESTANEAEPQNSSGTEGRLADNNTSASDDQNENSSMPLAAATETNKDTEASAKKALIVEGAGDSQTSHPLNDEAMGPQSALEPTFSIRETNTGVIGRSTVNDNIIATRTLSENDGGGDLESGDSKGPIPEGQSELIGDTSIESANTVNTDETTKSNADETKVGEIAASSPQNSDVLKGVKNEGPNSNKVVVPYTGNKATEDTKEESEQAIFVPDTNGVQHSQHDDTTKTGDVPGTTTEESPGNVISEDQHDASLLSPKNDQTPIDRLQPKDSVATNAHEESAEIDVVESENGPLRTLEAAETTIPGGVKPEPVSIATGQEQIGEPAEEPVPTLPLAVEGEVEPDTSPGGGTSESNLESAQKEQSIDLSSTPAMDETVGRGTAACASLPHDVSTSEQGDADHNDQKPGLKTQEEVASDASSMAGNATAEAVFAPLDASEEASPEGQGDESGSSSHQHDSMLVPATSSTKASSEQGDEANEALTPLDASQEQGERAPAFQQTGITTSQEVDAPDASVAGGYSTTNNASNEVDMPDKQADDALAIQNEPIVSPGDNLHDGTVRAGTATAEAAPEAHFISVEQVEEDSIDQQRETAIEQADASMVAGDAATDNTAAPLGVSEEQVNDMDSSNDKNTATQVRGALGVASEAGTETRDRAFVSLDVSEKQSTETVEPVTAPPDVSPDALVADAGATALNVSVSADADVSGDQKEEADSYQQHLGITVEQKHEQDSGMEAKSMCDATVSDSIERKSSLNETEPLVVVESDDNSVYSKESIPEHVEGGHVLADGDVLNVSAEEKVDLLVLDQVDTPKSEVMLDVQMNGVSLETDQSPAAHPSPTSLQKALNRSSGPDDSEVLRVSTEEKIPVLDQVDKTKSEEVLDVQMNEASLETEQSPTAHPSPTSLQKAAEGSNALDDSEVLHASAEEKIPDQVGAPKSKAVLDVQMNEASLETEQSPTAHPSPTSLQKATEGSYELDDSEVLHASAEEKIRDQVDALKSNVALDAQMNEISLESDQSLAASPIATSIQNAVKGSTELDDSEVLHASAEEKIPDQVGSPKSKAALDVQMNEASLETEQSPTARPSPTSLQKAAEGSNELDDREVLHASAEKIPDQVDAPKSKAVLAVQMNETLPETEQSLVAHPSPTSLQMALEGSNELDESEVPYVSAKKKIPDQVDTLKSNVALGVQMTETVPEIATSLQKAVCAETVTVAIVTEPVCAPGGREEQETEENEAVPEVKQSTSPNLHDRIGAFSFPGFPVPATIQSLRQGTTHDLDDVKSSFQRLVATTSSVASTLSEVAGPAILITAANARDISAPVISEASTLASSSAYAASCMAGEYRRKRDKTRGGQNLIVSFAQDEPEGIESGQPSASESTARPLASPDIASTPPHNSPAGKSDLEQTYRNEISQFLAISPNRESIRPNAANQCGSTTSQKRLDTNLEKSTDKYFQDPVLTAAMAGSEARKKRSNEKLESRILPLVSTGKIENSSLRRLTHFTASTATAMASVARPALQEVRDVAAAVRSSVKGGNAREEEVLIVGKSADGKLQLSTTNGRRALSTVGVSFEKVPLGRDTNTLSLRVQNQEDRTPTDQSKDTTSQGDGLGAQALKAMSSATSNLLTEGNVLLSGFTPPTLLGGSLTPTPATVELSTGFQNSKQKPPDVLNNPKDFKEFLASKLQGRGASDAWTKANRAAANSVFAHERKPSRSSSISSPDSPGVLSLASDSDDESDQNSLSTTSSPTKVLRMSHPAALLWDMVDETHLNFSRPNGNGMSLPTETPAKPSSAVSFDLDSPKVISAEVRVTANKKSTEETGRAESVQTSTEVSKDNTLPDLIAPFENSEKTEGSNLTMEPIPGENSKDKELENTADLQIPIASGGKGETAGDILETKDKVPLTPPRPQDGDAPILNQKTQVVSHRRRRDSDSRLDQSLALRAVKSADVAFDEGDSMSVSGYISLPGGNDHDNGSVHRGNRPSRHNLGSPQGSLMGNASFSGSRRGSLFSAKKSSSRRLSAYKRAPSSRRLLREGSVNLFPPLRAIESGEIPALRHSRSENNLMLTPNDDSDPSISFQPGLASDLDDLYGVGDGGGMFELAHTTFSSVTHSNILEKMMKPQSISDPMKYLASVQWRQLVANWKHLTLARALTERACSPHYQQESNSQEIPDEEEVTVSTGFVKSRAGILDLLNFHHLHGVIHPETKNLNGLVPHLADGDIVTLSNFLVEFGSSYCAKADTDPLARKPPHVVNIVPEATAKVTADTLVELAASDLKRFASFMEDIVHFAAHNHGASSSDDREPEVSYSVGLKSQEAIEKKSQTKYGGDLLQVKDTLRAQITFGDEGSLVAGLLRLVKRCKSQAGNGKDDYHVEIVRVKNLFQRSPSGSLCASSLPTGYRHVLITVRLNGLLLAGKIALFGRKLRTTSYYSNRANNLLSAQKFNFNWQRCLES